MRNWRFLAVLVLLHCIGVSAQEAATAPAATTSNSEARGATTPERWASPRELRHKKLIGTGQHSLHVTPRLLAEHPEYLANLPFDGLTVVAPLDAKWCEVQGVGPRTLDELAWNNIAVPAAAVEGVIADLKRIPWGSLTDNFLWFRMMRSDAEKPPRDLAADLSRDSDWDTVQKNAALSARVCRQGGLKGFMLDTEQYTSYVGVNGHYPMGRDTADLLRKRGAQWIKAIQDEYPSITIIIFFAWSPDLDSDQAPFLVGIKHFLNGVLEGIEAPARLVHACENTFYYGKTAGTLGFEAIPGDRAKYQSARESIRAWRSYSTAAEKYDKFVGVGMAAWMESDPFDLWDGWPSGTKDTMWSNLPLALAYSDEYVWLWSEHTHYGHAHDRGSALNPFLASLSNQTFNTGKEPAASLLEDFTTNPLRRGWYFDFDMLAIGRKNDPLHEFPSMSADAVPYRWSKDAGAVEVKGTWKSESSGDVAASLGQRRRYVHPIRPLSRNQGLHAEFDFRVDRFGSDPANPIVLGLFNSERTVDRQSLTVRIEGPNTVFVTVAGDGEPCVRSLPVEGGLQTGLTYRVSFTRTNEGTLAVSLTDPRSARLLADVSIDLPSSASQYELDEIGVAMWEANLRSTPVEKAYEYRLERVRLNDG